MSKKQIKYYVIYMFEAGVMGAIGSIEIEVKKKIKTFEDIKIVSDYISKNYCNNKSVIILNYIRIK